MNQTRPVDTLLDLMARLRDASTGCPWDRRQTFRSIAPYTLEEAYEVVDAIEREDADDLRCELGDLLLQVVFHARMAEEAGLFDFDGVTVAIIDKLIRRHPHVFSSDAPATTSTRPWEQIKREEREQKQKLTGAPDDRASVLDGVELTLPALARAIKLQQRAATVGFDWPQVDDIALKVHEELGETEAELAREPVRPQALENELGDLLFTCANLCRRNGVDPESALRGANQKFERRFRALEGRFDGNGEALADANLETLNRAWEAVKNTESGTKR